jgi:hypothetical protein
MGIPKFLAIPFGYMPLARDSGGPLIALLIGDFGSAFRLHNSVGFRNE